MLTAPSLPLLAALFFAPTAAQDLAAAPQSVAHTSATPLERALESVNDRAIRADMDFLAGPALGGRGTPSPELELAARYVEARLRRLGIEPGTTDGYQNRFDLSGLQLDVERCSISITAPEGQRTLQLGDGAYLRSGSDLIDVDVDAGVVAVGDGSRSVIDEVGDLTGSWALMFESGRGTTGAIRRLVDAGAAGVLVTPGNEYEREPYAERYADSLERLGKLRYSSPTSAPPEARTGAPVLLVDREVGTWMLSSLGFDAAPAPGTRLDLRVAERRAVTRKDASAPNVAGLLRGTDPELASQVLVLCAHLDHLGTDAEGVVYPGADDNASGTVGLLALAEAIVARGAYGRSVLFLWVSGEESGLWGSAMWCRDPRLPAGLAPRAAYNMDMIGRDAPATLWVTPTSEHAAFNPFAALAPELAGTEGFEDIVSQDSYWRASDHYSFASELRIPVLYLSSGEHDDYHKPTDLPERIDFDKLERIVRLTLRILERTDGLTLEPVESVDGRPR
ncbi:M28 family peptidase [Engelhardtia mirabilis]|uniref:Peptidase family M28 n=1 Tax=Engelhardtia mirabilis TaxID=2528011 RepID=A0A518BF86_9BACT|nr:Peptidase family M28 [Planctomycetes bacterium Pla133]QDU99888.1 Peptidase family M28 [Planctomycetes bacterium Pla86]